MKLQPRNRKGPDIGLNPSKQPSVANHVCDSNRRFDSLIMVVHRIVELPLSPKAVKELQRATD